MDELRVDWPDVRATMSLDGPAPIQALWQRWPWRLASQLWPLDGAKGVYVAASHDGVRHFSLRTP